MVPKVERTPGTLGRWCSAKAAGTCSASSTCACSACVRRRACVGAERFQIAARSFGIEHAQRQQLLPEPETPAMPTSFPSGISTLTSFRLWTRAPRTSIASGVGSFGTSDLLARHSRSRSFPHDTLNVGPATPHRPVSAAKELGVCQGARAEGTRGRYAREPWLEHRSI